MKRLVSMSLVMAFAMVAASAAVCSGQGSTNIWGQRWNIPYEDNTVGAELGIWPRKELDIFVQWVTPRLLDEHRIEMPDADALQRLSALLEDYIVVKVVAKRYSYKWSPFFEYPRWSILVGGQERKALVPSGAKPTAEGGFFMGQVPSGGTLTGWVFFRRVETGPQTVHILYDFGYQKTTFSFPPISRR